MHEALQGLSNVIVVVAESDAACAIAALREACILSTAEPVESYVAGRHNFNCHVEKPSARTISAEISNGE
jgi:hypothetical protein